MKHKINLGALVFMLMMSFGFETMLGRTVTNSILSNQHKINVINYQDQVGRRIFPEYEKNRQNAVVLCTSPNILILSGALTNRNVYGIDGGTVGRLGCPPTEEIFVVSERYQPNMREYQDVWKLYEGQWILPVPVEGEWKPPGTNGLYFVMVNYQQLTCLGDNFSVFGPLAEPDATTVLRTNYTAIRLSVDDGLHYGWMSFESFYSVASIYRQYWIHPEPGVAVQAGLIPASRLQIRRENSSLILEWDNLQSKWTDIRQPVWRLESSESISSSNGWRPVTGVESNRVVLLPSTASQFFRLVKDGGP